MNSDRILIVGWGRSGKDEAGAFFHQHLGIPYAGSTSWAALPLMADRLNLPEQLAWEQRQDNRQFWKDACDDIRKDDPLFLVRIALSGVRNPGHAPGRVVTGIRDKKEIDAARASGLFKHILWIHRPGVPEDFTVTFNVGDATGAIINSGTLQEFHFTLTRWAVARGLEPVLSEYAASLLLPPSITPTDDLIRE